ncbi:methyltransferase domain-containing protein [Luteimonas sp. 100069]|uniref:methyltransferase domain-containing protein n=1 Tax=Luteimonas sp. 100069 TaxID=2006109 RepID=UPI000F504D5E|nr:methyltransferase domain-containing protein [Luteimonas sp. 100069]
MSSNFDSRYTQYQLERSPLRKWVRQLYLSRAASLVEGPTLDFGCGIGELLKKLPQGSKGLEYNAATVDYCRSQALDVSAYDGFSDNWSLTVFPAGQKFRSMVISHVLEHLENPMMVFEKLLHAAARLDIQRVLVIVPGQAGFRIDPTHLTFVDLQMLTDGAGLAGTGFRPMKNSYFPGDLRLIGDWFPYHELQVLYARSPTAS